MPGFLFYLEGTEAVSDVFHDEEYVFAVEAEAVGGVQAGLGSGATVAA